jgi:serine/threonine-protein kinase
VARNRGWKAAALALAGIALFGAGAAAQPPAGHGPYFPADAPWYRDISTAPLDPQSAAVIADLAAHGGWGGGAVQIDFSIEVLQADASTPFRTFVPNSNFFDPDCDEVPMPVPAGGALEGESGYACVHNGDCHLIVVHPPTHLLYEMWKANITSPTHFDGGCLAVWDMTKTYPAEGRGNDCTSADAAGYPIAPLLFNADEVAAGHIDHAIRFILPNTRIRHFVYVHPATHSTGPTGGGANAIPYGGRLRLRADYPLATLPNEASRVVARAMQKYGILLSDGGTLALTAQSDKFTTAKWSTLFNDSFDLDALLVTDFQMVAGGQRFTYTGDCARISPIFFDSFELSNTSKWAAKVP